MNDNFAPDIPIERRSFDAWIAQIREVRDISTRAIGTPESLTMGEIQDIAWGFLMAARTLEKMAVLPAPARNVPGAHCG